MNRNNLELLVPPALLLVAAALLMWLIAVFISAAKVTIPFRTIIGCAVFAVGVLFDLLGLLHFRSARTTVNPIKVDTASSLVTSGIYRLSRNPMYVGFTLILLAWGIYLQNVLNIAVLIAFVIWLDRFQIVPEERVLEAKFGEQFRRYQREVRRWL